MRTVVLVLAALAVASAFIVTPENSEVAFKFSSWKSQYAKKYFSQAEEDHAFENFLVTIERIALKAKQFPETQWGLTKFADLSSAEFAKMYLTHRPRAIDMNSITVAELPEVAVEALPEQFDWRSHTPSVVSPVKDQEQCGSCWAFSATETIESAWAMSGRSLPILAPQQIVDCDNIEGASGCNGGYTESAFDYVKQAGGLDTEESYPYQGQDGTCAFKKDKVAAQVTGYSYAVPPCQDACDNQNQTLAMTALVSVGPLAICVDASTWSDYTGGIFSDCSHNANDQDHCVQLVGFNRNSGYWIVRNSWNTDWGINGYIHLKLGNTCGLLDDINFPHVPAKTA